MERRLKLPIAVAALAAAAAAGGACAWALLAAAPAAVPAAVPAAILEAKAPIAVVEHCRQAAELLYEVNWAAECFKSNQDNDCTLPNDQAAKVNSILEAEQARCMASETQARAGP
jgi:hypothetical protein